MYSSRRRRFGGLGLFLLVKELLGNGPIPLITSLLIITQIIVFLRPPHPYFRWPTVSEVCIRPVDVWYRDQWKRMFLGALFHLDEWHLYYNMVSLLWKGKFLERKFGGLFYAFMLIILTFLCGVMEVFLSFAASKWLSIDSYLYDCAVGFSGVLFALKVINSYLHPSQNYQVMGVFNISSRLACWAEIFIIQVLVPNASFIGHLSGILVGIIYIKGPLHGILLSILGTARQFHQHTRPSYTYRSGTSGYRTPNNHRTDHYSAYTGGLSEDQQLQRAYEESLRHQQNSYERHPTAPPMENPEENRTREARSHLNRRHQSESPPNTINRTNRSSLENDNDVLRRKRIQRFT